MQQRGRKSSDSLSVVRVAPTERVSPPERLAPSEAAIWREIVSSKPADWFGSDNLPLLEHYCTMVAESQRVASQLRLVSPECLDDYERLISLQTKIGGQLASLATKMRLTQQSRYGARAAATASDRTPTRKPWEFGT
jgi:hypothetical protein